MVVIEAPTLNEGFRFTGKPHLGSCDDTVVLHRLVPERAGHAQARVVLKSAVPSCVLPLLVLPVMLVVVVVVVAAAGF